MYRIPRKLKKLYRKDGWQLKVGPISGNIYGRDLLVAGWGGWELISEYKERK